MIDKKAPICPISFVNKEIVCDPDVNGLFTNPIESKISVDVVNSLTIDGIKNSIISSDNSKGWSCSLQDLDRIAYNDSIMSYLVMNITDLSYNLLIRFVESVFSTGKDIANDADLVNTFMGSNFIKSDIRNEVINALNLRFTSPIYNISINQVYLEFEMCMDSVYAIMVAKVFDKYITDHIQLAIDNNALKTLYDAVYYKCFDKDPEVSVSMQTMYAFCSSMMREIMGECLLEYRKMLMLIAKTASYMVIAKPDYVDHILDKTYTTTNMIESNNFISNIISCSNSIGEKHE